MPVIAGVKSECEKFAGAESTHTIEGEADRSAGHLTCYMLLSDSSGGRNWM